MSTQNKKHQILIRTCPGCGSCMSYLTEQGFRLGVERKAVCKVCQGRYISSLLRGRPKTEEHKRRLSESKIGRPGHTLSQHARAKIAESLRGRPKSEEHRKKISEAKKGKPHKGCIPSEETRQKIREALLGRKMSPEARAKMSATRRGRKMPPRTEEHKRKIAEAAKGRVPSKATRAKISASIKGKKQSAETCLKRSRAMKKLYAASDFHQRVMNGIKKNFRGGKKECPNKFEIQLASILDSLFKDEYKFVGDGTTIIGGLNPDFINVNGQKKIIELFGELFHKQSQCGWKIRKNATEKGRKTTFRNYGFKTLIVWCSDLNNLSKLRRKLVKFHGS